jgi:hypothetical protein
MPVCGNQLLDMGVDAIMIDGIPEEFITDVLERAASEGVPVITGGGTVDPINYYIASFSADDTDMGVELAKWVAEQLPDGGDMIVQTFPAAWSSLRIDGLNSVIEGTDLQVVDTWEADPTNMVDGTNADVTSKLQQYPDTDVVWINFSVASIGAGQAIGALPEDQQPLLVTFYANPSTVADINAGRIDAAVDESLEWSSWAGVDALMQLFARGQQPSQESAPTYNGVNPNRSTSGRRKSPTTPRSMSRLMTSPASSHRSAIWLPRSACATGVTHSTRPSGTYSSTHSRKKSVRARDLARTASMPTPSQTSSAASRASIERMSGVPTRPRVAPGAGAYSGRMPKGSACEVQPGRGESNRSWCSCRT